MASLKIQKVSELNLRLRYVQDTFANDRRLLSSKVQGIIFHYSYMANLAKLPFERFQVLHETRIRNRLNQKMFVFNFLRIAYV